MTIIPHHFGSQVKAKLRHYRIRQLTKQDWQKRHAKVFQLNPAYRRPCPAAIEKEHRDLWRQLRSDISLDTLHVCYGISGKASAEIIPEEVYISEIEPCLNRHRESVFLANKNFYNRWFTGGVFPAVFVHNIEGVFYDANYQVLPSTSVNAVIQNLPFPVVIKPSRGPGGGRGVYFVKNPQMLNEKMAGQQNFVVQQQIRQHEFFDKFNATGLNTLRVCTYRSVTDNQVHVLNVTMRMGKGGSLDNETSGGIVCNVNDDGSLTHYALDKYGAKYFMHPDTHINFSKTDIIPRLAELKQLSIAFAKDIYLTRLASLDATMDNTGNWRLIEMNLFNQTIRFAQYAGKPFFRQFTHEVIEHCIQHPEWR